MDKRIKDLQKKQYKLQTQITKMQEIAQRQPIEKTKFSELYDDFGIPPYGFTMFTFYKLGPESFEDLTQEPSNGRVRGKFEKGVEKAIVGTMCGILTAFTVPIVAVLESPLALPALGITAAQSATYTKYNKNIEKAKDKLVELKSKYEKNQIALNQAIQEQQGQMEL